MGPARRKGKILPVGDLDQRSLTPSSKSHGVSDHLGRDRERFVVNGLARGRGAAGDRVEAVVSYLATRNESDRSSIRSFQRLTHGS